MNITITKLTLIKEFYRKFDDYYSAYVLPFLILLALLNNISVLLILQKSLRVRLSIVTHIRAFYIAFAIGEINMVVSYFLRKFLGMIRSNLNLIIKVFV